MRDVIALNSKGEEIGDVSSINTHVGSWGIKCTNFCVVEVLFVEDKEVSAILKTLRTLTIFDDMDNYDDVLKLKNNYKFYLVFRKNLSKSMKSLECKGLRILHDPNMWFPAEGACVKGRKYVRKGDWGQVPLFPGFFYHVVESKIRLGELRGESFVLKTYPSSSNKIVRTKDLVYLEEGNKLVNLANFWGKKRFKDGLMYLYPEDREPFAMSEKTMASLKSIKTCLLSQGLCFFPSKMEYFMYFIDAMEEV